MKNLTNKDFFKIVFIAYQKSIKDYNRVLLNILNKEGIEKLKEVLKGSQINSKN